MNETLDRHWFLKSKTEIVALGWEKFMDHMKGEEVWIILPQDFEKILPAAGTTSRAYVRRWRNQCLFSDANIDEVAKRRGLLLFSLQV